MAQYVTRNDELSHYGVLGMKWGVRRNTSKAYYKATHKADKLERKATSTNLKAAKLQSKALKKENRATSDSDFEKARKQRIKANKMSLKSAKLQKKSYKWTKNMEDAFKDVKRSDISQESLDNGRKYVYMLLNE